MIHDALDTEKLDKFRRIKDKFLEDTQLPEFGKWRSMSNDNIWLRVVSQVVVVGNAAPAEKLNNTEIQARLAFNKLTRLCPRKAKQVLGGVLADIGTRYVSQARPETSPKVRALLRNLAFLKEFTDGPHGLVNCLANLTTSQERIDYLSKNFSYFKAKGARDFLTTGLGMATDVIALDSRVMGIVRRIVPELPAKVNNKKNYKDIETFLVTHVCQPLKMSPVAFDQLLFRNETAIKELLSCDATVVHDGPSLAASGSSSCGTSKRPVAAKMDRRRRLR
ncbi:hypothetical protein FE249_20675 (plasmid) [Acidiphilium multivorum]|uniref:hypothetical protein n=1 Tax=Acidiphilium multivorum TaxID=62140 RepID=UPI001F4BD6EE|nr:hypothetical protein [Acidiphilium multivorum]UNC16585.1 hypothetical protein FE249_20675 [Acidiphilium multivorum]